MSPRRQSHYEAAEPLVPRDAAPPPDLAVFSGTAHSAEQASDMLRRAGAQCNLITPATSCNALAEGWEIAFSAFLVDVARDTYRASASDREERTDVREDQRGGLRSLGRTPLDRLGMALGVSWLPQQSYRVDDGSDAHYCCYKATGSYLHFDGRAITISNEKQVDLRRFGGDTMAIEADARRNGRSPEIRLLQDRRNILSLAVTKARLRALRDLGVRAGYTIEELGRPFVVARAVFTGRTEDPVLRREFALMHARSAMWPGGAADRLYGPAERQRLTVRAEAAPAQQLTGPEAVAAVQRFAQGPGLAAAPRAATAPPRAPEPAPASPPSPAAVPHGGAREAGYESAARMRFGRAKGLCLFEASDADLSWYADALAAMVADPRRARYRADNEQHLQEVQAEILRRSEEPSGFDEEDPMPEGWR